MQARPSLVTHSLVLLGGGCDSRSAFLWHKGSLTSPNVSVGLGGLAGVGAVPSS